MKIIEVVNALEQFAPLPLQEDYDNAGLQVGLTEAEVSGALLCLDVTEAIVDEAVSKGCNLIVSHHPLIFHKLRRLTGDDYVQRTVMKAIEKKVTILSLHTNMDSVKGGVNFKIAEKMRLEKVSFLGKTQTVSVPFNAGITANDNCHCVEGGEGVVGYLPAPMAADDFMIMLKHTFGAESVRANELIRRDICKVALCGGAGDFLLDEALKVGADAFITGEMHYHQFFGLEQKIQLAIIGHYESEQYTTEIFRDIIMEKCPDVRCMITETNTNPIIYL